MQKTETIETQKLRLQKYPKDRIPFMNSEYVASEDKAVFEQYRNKQISKEHAMRIIAKNNLTISSNFLDMNHILKVILNEVERSRRT